VLYLNVEFRQGLYPAGQNTLGPFEGHQPFKAVVVSKQNDLGPELIVAEMLNRSDDG